LLLRNAGPFACGDRSRSLLFPRAKRHAPDRSTHWTTLTEHGYKPAACGD